MVSAKYHERYSFNDEDSLSRNSNLGNSHTSDYLKYVCKFVLMLALDEISIAKSGHTRLIADS